LPTGCRSSSRVREFLSHWFPSWSKSGALQNVGNGRALLEHLLPAQLQPVIPKIIAGANNALALSIGDLFWITIVSGVLGLAFTLVLRDRPLRTAAELRTAALAAGGDGYQPEDRIVASDSV
jgi:hypothetical protein